MIYLGLYDEAGERREGPLLISPDDAAHLASARSRPRRRERCRASRGIVRSGKGGASKLPCPSFSRAPLRSRRLLWKRARRFLSCVHFISVRPMRGRNSRAWRDADADRDPCLAPRAHTIRRHGGDSAGSCFAKRLERSRHGAIPGKPRYALPDRVCRDDSGRRLPRPSHRTEAPPTRPSSSRSGSRPLVATRASAERCWKLPWPLAREPGLSACSSKSRRATRRRSRSTARSAPKPSAAARAITTAVRTPRSSALPFRPLPPMMAQVSARGLAAIHGQDRDERSRLERLCAERGMRMTGQRRTIARVLSEAEDHPDVEEVYRRASAQDPRISLSTVYRTVRLFENEGHPRAPRVRRREARALRARGPRPSRPPDQRQDRRGHRVPQRADRDACKRASRASSASA